MKSTRVVLLGLACGAALFAHHSKHTTKARATSGQFDYYVLSLSWAPDFCATAGSNGTANECGAGRKVGFVVHGLWPQGENGRGPESCGPAQPVSAALVNQMLHYFPTASLVQHEWATHGTCTGLSQMDYFNQVAKARQSVKDPAQLTGLTTRVQESESQVEQQLASANSSFPAAAFRATCTNGMLQEARVCFDKNLNPRACSMSAGQCASGQMTILPPR